jgi:hypothetical protein
MNDGSVATINNERSVVKRESHVDKSDGTRQGKARRDGSKEESTESIE